MATAESLAMAPSAAYMQRKSRLIMLLGAHYCIAHNGL